MRVREGRGGVEVERKCIENGAMGETRSNERELISLFRRLFSNACRYRSLAWSPSPQHPSYHLCPLENRFAVLERRNHSVRPSLSAPCSSSLETDPLFLRPLTPLFLLSTSNRPSPSSQPASSPPSSPSTEPIPSLTSSPTQLPSSSSSPSVTLPFPSSGSWG